MFTPMSDGVVAAEVDYYSDRLEAEDIGKSYRADSRGRIVYSKNSSWDPLMKVFVKKPIATMLVDRGGRFLMIYICNFHIFNHLLLIYICKLN